LQYELRQAFFLCLYAQHEKTFPSSIQGHSHARSGQAEGGLVHKLCWKAFKWSAYIFRLQR